jgi:hypothetical protein
MKDRLVCRILPGAAVLLVLWSGEAHCEDAGPDTVKVDPFVPVWTTFMKSGDTDVSMGSKMEVMSLPRGWLMNSLISVESKSYRGRDMQDIVEQFMHQAGKMKTGIYTANIVLGETYSKKKSLGLARFGKDMIFQKQSAAMSVVYAKPVLRATSSQISVSGDARRGQSDFKYDKTLTGGAGSSFTYDFGGLVRVRGGGGLERRRETSEIESIAFNGLPSRSDTLRFEAQYGRGEDKLLAVQYRKVSAVDRKVAPPRGNSLEIIDDPTAAQIEESRINGEELALDSNVQLFPFLFMRVQFGHDVRSQKNKVETRLSKEMENTSLAAITDYRFSKSGNLRVNVETSEKTDDYGPLSLSSFKEKEKMVGMRLSQDVTDSLSVSMSGAASLKQRFYKKQDANPRDADYLYYKLEADMRAAPLPRVSADITGTMTRNEIINIDGTLSSDNRIDYLYRLVPKIGVRPTSWLDIRQEYSIKIEYTDFVYKEDENYLNRTTTMITDAKFKMLRRFLFNFRHVYLMKDSGSYLLRDGVRRYNRNGESFEYGLSLKAAYEPTVGLSFIAETDFRNQKNNRLGFIEGKKVIVSSTTYDSGGLRLGVRRSRRFWGSGKMNFDINYVKRFGPYLSAERRQYWDVDSSIAFGF